MTYVELLRRFGFDVVYSHDVAAAKSSLRHYEKQLEEAKNGIFQPFTFAFIERNKESEEAEIEFLQNQVNEYKERLRYYQEDCIIE